MGQTTTDDPSLAISDQLLHFIHTLVLMSNPDAHLTNCNASLNQFINNYSPDTLFIIKFDNSEYHILNELSSIESLGNIVSIIILIKLKGRLVCSISFDNQVNILNIPTTQILSNNDNNNESFEKLRSLINLGIAPYFELITLSSKSEESSNSVNVTRKKFNELSLSLQNLQQKIQIPDLLISVHPKIKQLVESKKEVADELISDTVFLNELTNIVNNWIKQIQSITTLDHKPSDGESITEEIQFWKSMELALISLNQQTSSDEIITSIEVLNKAKRFHITLSFQNDIGLNDKITLAKVYNALLKDLPIDELVSVSSNDNDNLNTFEISIINIFSHLKKLKNLNSFPLIRAIEVIEIILLDITNKFLTILSNYSIMSLSLDAFLDLYNHWILRIVNTIDQNVKFMINLIRELLRKRQEKFIVIKINQTSFNVLRERLQYLKSFRLRHDDLLLTLDHVLQNNESHKLVDAYNKYIIPTNALDSSKQGLIIWSNNEKSYFSIYQNLELLILRKLNDIFAACSTFNDFISIINQFKSFEQHSNEDSIHLLSLINDEFKLKILSIAHDEIEFLINLNLNQNTKLTKSIQTFNNFNRITLGSDDNDSIVAKISWNIGLIHKLKFYIDYLQKLLGLNWNKYSLGSKIYSETTSLIENLNPESLFLQWLEDVTNLSAGANHKFNFQGPILKIIDLPNLDLFVNFDYKLIRISREINQLINLGFKIPVNLLIQFKKIDKLYPFIIGLIEHVDILKKVVQLDLAKTDYGIKFGFLVEDQRAKILFCLKQVAEIDWLYLSQAFDLQKINNDSDIDGNTNNENLIEIKSLTNLTKFQEEIYKLYDQVNKLSKLHDFLSNDIYIRLKQCEFNYKAIAVLIELVQQEIIKLSFEKFTETDRLCELVNKDLEEILISKCEIQLLILSQNLSVNNNEDFDEDTEERIESGILISEMTHSIIFQDQSFVISPPLESTKQIWFNKIDEILSIIENQCIIKVNTNYFEKFTRIGLNEKISNLISNILNKIDTTIEVGNNYFQQWIVLQNLWELNLNSDEDSNKLLPINSNLNKWLEIIYKILELRLIFDRADNFHKIGNFLVISFSKVQSRVNLKFDNFQNGLIIKFSKIYQDYLVKFNNELLRAKEILGLKFDLQGDILKLILNIEKFLDFKELLSSWLVNLSIFKKTQTLLYKQRFKFPSRWIYIEQLENNLSIITELLKRKECLIEENFELISSKLKMESIKINDLLNSLIKDWSTKKPISGNLNPSIAIVNLDNFQQKCCSIDNNKKAVLNVSKFLDIAINVDGDLQDVVEEIQDLKLVWSSINSLWEELERIKLFKWSEVQPRHLRRQLEELLNSSRSLPAKIRQYAAFDEIQNQIKLYIKNFSFINDLKNDAMKPRHWKNLLKQLNFENISYEVLTVGDIWNLNIKLNEEVIKSVLNQANNEKTIEDNLNNIKEDWSTITLEVFNYENKCRLVKNWDKLFDQCNNNLNSLASMKNSPFYNNFEQEITELEEKLNKLFILLDTWIDVQRQWAYLDGVFGNKNNDIKNILPIESARFSNITYEFLNTLKRIYKYNLVIEILLVTDVQVIMEKFLESLVKVRKSLTDYLEKQRELFPRFYFVGNEDLLEIIGSSVDINRISKHLKKMFIGIASIDSNKEDSTIVAINSEQNEKVRLINPVSLIKFPRLNEWLKELELEVKLTLSKLTKDAIDEFKSCFRDLSNVDDSKLINLIDTLPAQISTLACQIIFTEFIESAIKVGSLNSHLEFYSNLIKNLTQLVASEISNTQRKKIEYLTIEVLHQRDIINSLIKAKSKSEISFIWNIQQLYYYDQSSKDLLTSLKIKQANAEFIYGFEYLGIPEKLAYTPLIDKCFLAMTQALDQRLGGSPFGPAGTGKTESIKALGNNLGKMVLVFCCDESFDFQSMGRIFLGLCKVGCWGCFDEFNRLDEKILSAVSSQIESIEVGLSKPESQVEISGKSVHINPETGIFVTMNPGYAGRYELPENLKKLFRNFSMEKPDREIIVEVLLTSQAFLNSKELAAVIVPFLLDIERSASNQPHYDFGLRTLKSALTRCGASKRAINNEGTDTKLLEYKLILQSMRETISPKLIKEDELVLNNLEKRYFPGITYDNQDYSKFITELEKYGHEKGLSMTDSWINKALQFYQLQNNHHGIMLVGEAGSGKSTVWKSVLDSLSIIDGVDNMSYVIDCKIMHKDNIYGALDIVTRDWTDGLFTSILRKIRSNLRGEMSKRIWIVFDGDIDPEWAENLNSVLDDNKILTLPNGERLAIPHNVRLIFEVDSLKFTTPATISRCGMIWFDSSLILIDDQFTYFMYDLFNSPIVLMDELVGDNDEIISIQRKLSDYIANIINKETLLKVIEESQKYSHIMKFTIHRALQTLSTLIKSYCRRYIIYSLNNRGVPIDDPDKYFRKAVLLSLIWALAGDCSLKERENFSEEISKLDCFSQLECIEEGTCHIDYDIALPEGDWVKWISKVQYIDIEPQHVTNPNTVISTLDTVRHENLIYSILNEHKPLLLCGPPGSGKTMTLLEALRKSPNLDVLSLNFSKDTSPVSLMKSLEQYCDYKKTNNGVILAPKISDKWVVVFCDEINLPGIDKYGTQRVISLIRQMIEHKGFWKEKGKQWVTLSNIQFVGACNSPNDPGRHKLTDRFLRHVSLIMVDYPGKNSLSQIYQTFNLAVMKCAPDLRGYAKTITEAMIEVYSKTKEKLTSALQDHYIYSPRELTRWCRGILEALKTSKYTNLSSLVRLWYHEGLRLFYDRLVNDSERQWTKNLFKETVTIFFPNIDTAVTLKEPVLYSNWLSSTYESVNEIELRSFVNERLRVFSEEEIDVNLVLYEDLLDYALRIDRVLRQPQGHMILVGPCTSGKTTLSKFVAWINGLKIIQLNVHKNYGLTEFDFTLRDILIKCASGDKVCFIIDESSILETSFIERMNTLLANAEIPGLFEGENFSSLMTLCIEQSHSQGLLLDTNDELYEWFTQQISENLHVIFTISDMNDANRPQVVSSPALFNRCVLSWMGDWSNNTLFSIASKQIESVPLDMSNYVIPATFNQFVPSHVSGFRDVIVDVIVYFHRLELDYETSLSCFNTPGSFMVFIEKFVNIFNDKQYELEENQRHISNGLDKLRETVIQVNELKKILSKKNNYLTLKDKEAKAMLNKMLMDQNEAERKQEFSVETKAELAKQEIEIESRKAKVMKDLQLAEPAVLEAQRGVQNIKKQHLTEIRSMSNPPAAVKMTMESVCILIGYEVSSWRDVQLIVRRDDFIANIVSFDNQLQLTSEIREYMEQVYLSRDDYNYETVNRASKACGPLLQWVKAQLAYCRMLESIGPLRDEVHALESQTKKTKAQLIAIDQMIDELEESIENYKESYRSLVREAENIKMEMKSVETKVNRSLKLIDNLTSERERWKLSIIKFGDQRERLIGNSILAAAFLVYAGIYDQMGRRLLLEQWRDKLTSSGIAFDANISISNYLANGSEILKWETCGLPNDDLNIENFIIMKWSQMPIIIDPSSKVINILSKSFLPKKLIITSFLNDDFVKQLENSLRFGGAILIQDAEYYDPILDSVLRNEIYKNGGRMMVKLGDQLIDYSQDFKLFLHSRDSSVNLPAFVAARASIVNFTITSGSLENQILNITLQDLRPDLEEKRTEVVVLQSEYQVRLYNLEEELLSSLSDSSGNILDNDIIVNTLENLKAESTDIDSKMSESKSIMEAVDQVRNKYYDVARHSSVTFNILKQLSGLSKFYNFSLESFVSIFIFVLKSKHNDDKEGETNAFVREFYKEMYSRVSPSLKHSDKIVFALGLSFAYYTLEIGQHFKDTCTKILNSIINGKYSDSLNEILDSIYTKRDNSDDITLEILNDILSTNQDNETLSILSGLIRSLLLSEDRKDYFMDGFTEMSSFLFTGIGSYSSKYDLGDWLSNKYDKSFPIILASPEGFDATLKVERLANKLNEKLVIVSMGSKEGIEIANNEIDLAATKGTWILIQNIHMSSNWLNHLEKKLETISTNSNFKIFLTCTLSSNIPAALINKSKVLIFENQPGLRNNVIETYNSITNELLENNSSEFNHICFLIAWFHSIIQERLRYAPISFAKKYDINDSDFNAGISVIAKLFKQIKNGRSNISPDLIPWEELRYLIGEITYGSKIDDNEDLKYIVELANSLFKIESFENDFNLIENELTNRLGAKLAIPEGITTDAYKTWIASLPDHCPLAWIGLEEEVSILLREREGHQVAHNVLNILI